MANPSELPELVGEFVDMSKEYLRQETIEPAKQLGRFAGYTMAAGIAFALGVFFLSIAGMRWLLEAMPGDAGDAYWQGLGYVVAAIGVVLVAGIVVFAGSRASGKGG